MKETIYMIPVNDAFNSDCECPLCVLEKDLENKSIDFILGPSSMEPGTRIVTNEKGFCRRHWQLLYTRRANVLGLSLVLETHIEHQMALYNKMIDSSRKSILTDSKAAALSDMTSQIIKKNTSTTRYVASVNQFLETLESTCAICDRMNTTMDRYLDVLFWMYFRDSDFKDKVLNSKGFCLRHYHLLLKAALSHLSPKHLSIFVLEIEKLMQDNMNRILSEIQWFSQKFDHQNEQASWKNSKDAVPRTIEKFVSYGDFK